MSPWVGDGINTTEQAKRCTFKGVQSYGVTPPPEVTQGDVSHCYDMYTSTGTDAKKQRAATKSCSANDDVAGPCSADFHSLIFSRQISTLHER